MKSCSFHVGDWFVEPGLNRISRGGEQGTLQPLIMKLLVLLSCNPGDLVPKEHIMSKLWPRTIVTDNALTRAVSQLRNKLGDDAREPKFISTVMTKGYCLVAEVRQRTPYSASSRCRGHGGPRIPFSFQQMSQESSSGLWMHSRLRGFRREAS